MKPMHSLAIAAASLTVAVVALAAAVQARSHAREAIDGEVAALRERVEVAERAASRGVVRRLDAESGAAHRELREAPPEPRPASPVESGEIEIDAAADAAPPEPTAPKAVLPRYARIDVPSGVDVTQHDNGSLALSNSDPELENEIIRVEALREDGSIEMITLRIPPAT